MSSTAYKGLVLAVHPIERGFGWVLFEGPLAPVDWAIARVQSNRRDARLTARFARLLARYEPATLVLEEFEHRLRHQQRNRDLCRQIVNLAKHNGVDVQVFKRSVIRTIFATAGARTRYEIAEVIASQLDALSHKKPYKRRNFERQDPRQALFDAAALAMSYFAIVQRL